uniref:Uncharacterized protein n=1 Tax=Cacopsylla melanoneura TaxID=428564 RepID=A0A8D9FAM4_9HEMI
MSSPRWLVESLIVSYRTYSVLIGTVRPYYYNYYVHIIHSFNHSCESPLILHTYFVSYCVHNSSIGFPVYVFCMVIGSEVSHWSVYVSNKFSVQFNCLVKFYAENISSGSQASESKVVYLFVSICSQSKVVYLLFLSVFQIQSIVYLFV